MGRGGEALLFPRLQCILSPGGGHLPIFHPFSIAKTIAKERSCCEVCDLREVEHKRVKIHCYRGKPSNIT